MPPRRPASAVTAASWRRVSIVVATRSRGARLGAREHAPAGHELAAGAPAQALLEDLLQPVLARPASPRGKPRA